MLRSTVSPRAGLSLLAAALLAGCTTVGPDFKTPPPPSAKAYTATGLPASTASAPGTLGPAQRFTPAASVQTQWWTSFGSSRLDALVQQALHNSPTLQAAQATLRQARETYRAQAGSTLYPTVTAKLGASRNGINGATQGVGGNTQHIFNLYNAGVAVNYNLDLFGGNRRALEALAAQADYQRWQLAGARLSVAGNVVTTLPARVRRAPASW